MVLKRIHIVGLVALVVLSAFSISYYSIPPQHVRLMEKRVQKHFNKLDVKLAYGKMQGDTSEFGEGFIIPIVNKKDSQIAVLHYRIANACSFGGCVSVNCDTAGQGFKEHIYYFAILSSIDSIEKLAVLEYQSTYGYEMTSHSWLKQFYNSKIGQFELNKNIDGISGATVSVNAMINDLNSLATP